MRLESNKETVLCRIRLWVEEDKVVQEKLKFRVRVTPLSYRPTPHTDEDHKNGFSCRMTNIVQKQDLLRVTANAWTSPTVIDRDIHYLPEDEETAINLIRDNVRQEVVRRLQIASQLSCAWMRYGDNPTDRQSLV